MDRHKKDQNYESYDDYSYQADYYGYGHEDENHQEYSKYQGGYDKNKPKLKQSYASGEKQSLDHHQRKGDDY